jgi:hypothetical protein
MGLLTFPAATINALAPATSVTSTAANTAYNSVVSLDAGIYTVTCASSTIAEVSFYSGNTLLTTVRTASGTVNANLSSAVTNVSYWTNTGTSVIINMSKIGSLFTNTAPSGTLDTLTTSGTYTQTGKAFVVAVGGGGAGGGNIGGWSGAGGGSGGVASGVTTLTGSLSYTIGAGGTAGVNVIGGSGGTTTFGLVSATGGSPGGVGSYNTGGAGGLPGGGAGAGYNNQTNYASSSPDYVFVKTGTTGGGRGSGYGPYGSGIGTGGADSAVGSGYGAGGGGSTASTTGTAGQPGVIYVLRY